MLYEVITREVDERADLILGLVERLELLRITSYNVCYTKLLRLGLQPGLDYNSTVGKLINTEYFYGLEH